jgi:hypothetical protein
MKKQIIIFSSLVILFMTLTQTLYPQDSGRRYTFIAKDGSQIINVLLIQEKENTYIVQISNENKQIVINKKNIEKLIQIDSEVPQHFHPVIGKKSEIILPADSDQKQDSTSVTGDYYLSFGLAGYGISNLNGSESYNSGGWGGEFLSVLGFNKMKYFQTGLGLNYNNFDSSIPEKSSSISLYCLFAYFQISDKPEFLSFDSLYLRPFIGADLGGALLYKYSKKEDEEEDNNQSRTEKIYPEEPYYGFRLGFGVNPVNSIPVELLLSFQYSVVDDNDIRSFAKFSFGVNYYFH